MKTLSRSTTLCGTRIFLFVNTHVRFYKESLPKVFNKKSNHSSQWIQRQITDRYVLKAKNENYRSRAAYKLIELDNKYMFLKKNKIILDIGCYPGSWCQVILERTKNYSNEIIGIDKKIMDPLPNIHFIQAEIGGEKKNENNTLLDDKLREILQGKKIDIILSDAAVPCIGNKIDDHLNSCELTLSITNFMEQYINMGGTYVVKMYLGSQTENLKTYLKTIFQFVNTTKPKASRSESREVYLVCRNFLGRKKIGEDVQIKGAFSLKEGYY
ncbi:ribosomal RNA large subunit methyltransferase J [Plasmodium gonderi]|uniref:rRNA methyltransferase 2, mitochondrial n=1 Tax=Plasmodium gonderi TaxID=77519 RepID=A0A1Y1JTS1_PLAGO|nr:ribosomal RNA large subunit methyltransferase J [Plasmodium gonderi]GAW83304.1 ribosomal RNA large subunit methyltransferase J [Plasmodium gonderi]